jgi:predicted regulator of Ras-like GTPase activity (Roadblock/LC7/MglB family)
VLTSLFGELGPALGLKRAGGDGADAGFAATAILESVATEVNSRGQMVDRHAHDLVVVGSPAQAIREHFADTRADLDTASSLIALLDPAGVWASAVIKALSDAGGRPIERLHLRAQTTLKTLATIERTTLVRRNEDTLRIYHADVRTPGDAHAEIPIALMERSQMAVVIIGPLPPGAIDSLLDSLLAAAMLPTWRCPNLLFMLPPSAVWIANKIGSIAWPGRLHVHVINESMSGVSSVWNALLGMWNQVRAEPGWDDSGHAPLTGLPLRLAEPGPVPVALPRDAMGRGAPSVRAARALLDPARATSSLARLAAIEGLIGCAVVDATTGLVIARDSDDAPSSPAMDVAAAACAQVLRAHRLASHSLGAGEQVDEVMSSGGQRQWVLRTLSHHPELFLFALLDRQRANLALARFYLMDAERGMQ